MSIYTEIQNAATTTELSDLVDNELRARDADRNLGLTWGEQADRWDDMLDDDPPNSGGLVELVDILRAAEAKWFELEQ